MKMPEQLGTLAEESNVITDTQTVGFDSLRRNIISSATRDLENTAPEYVSTFRKSLPTKGYEQSLIAVKGIAIGSSFNKWRDICTGLLDVELAMHQLTTSLCLLKAPAPAYLTVGEWVIYHHDVWAIRTQGLLSRFEKLALKVVRKLVETSNPNFTILENYIRVEVRKLKDKVGKVRDPIAHGGGPIEALRNEGLIEPTLLIGGQVNMKDVFEPMASYQQKWHRKAYDTSILILAEIDRLSEKLNGDVAWD
jgi:hypothetical protein